MLTPFGSVVILEKTNGLLIADTARNILRIYHTLEMPDNEQGWNGCTYKCQWKRAQDVAGVVQALLIVVPNGNEFGRIKSLAITVNAEANTLTITAPPYKLALAKNLINEIDTRPVILGPRVTDLDIRKYAVPAGTAETVVKMLLEKEPTLRAIAVTKTNEILVLATPRQHTEIESKLKDIIKHAEKLGVSFGCFRRQIIIIFIIMTNHKRQTENEDATEGRGPDARISEVD